MLPDELLTVLGTVAGPSTATAEKFVAMWLRSPARSFENVR